MTATPFPEPAVPPLPEPYQTPSALNFSTVVGWPEGRKPAAPDGFEVTLYADGLDYPRWFHLLPNGDVLVAESNAPPKDEDGGIKGWVMNLVMSRAGAGVPSANRISLLRDGDGDGIARCDLGAFERAGP